MVEHGRLKDPVLHVIGFGRALGATIGDPNSFQNVFSNLSQRVLTPATVFSFYQPTAMIPGQATYFGPEFQLYPPALAIQRANFIYGILTGQYGSAYSVDRAPFQAAAGDPAGLVDMVNQRLMMGRMSSQLRQVLITATQAVPASDPNQRAIGAIYLAAISSEYRSTAAASAPAASSRPTCSRPPVSARCNISGNVITLRWNPPALGPAPTGYLLEGSLSPGSPIAAIPTGSPAAQFSLAAPTGSFYLRLRAMNGGELSLPSNEIRVWVNVPRVPSAPANFQAAVRGSALWLAWQNTYGGGAPTGIVMDVTGGATATLPLPLGESFSVPGIPNGTFTLRLRAVNAAGASSQSGSVTITAPSSNCAAPRVPAAYFATRVGNAGGDVVGAAGWRHAGDQLPHHRHRLDQRGGPGGRPRLCGRRAAGHLRSQRAGGERLRFGSVHGVPDRGDSLAASRLSRAIAMHTHTPARRHFLKLSARLATLGLAGMGFEPTRRLFVSEAFAAPVNDYKALVCIYLFGGNDCNNTVVSVDNYAAVPGPARIAGADPGAADAGDRRQRRPASTRSSTRSPSCTPPTARASWRSC